MDKVLSIIVPTYNMERYLDKCLSSLLVTDQNLLNALEVLVINDGSKDTSSEIGHRYQNDYPTVFRVIDKENGNYGSCINRGLKEATGKYVKILDADDYFDTVSLGKFLEILMQIDADVIFSDYSAVVNGDETKHIDEMDKSLARNVPIRFDENIATILGQNMQMYYITYKTQNLRDISYCQTEGISYTDTEWRYTPMSTARTIYVTCLNLYVYYIGRDGQTMDRNVRSKKMADFIMILDYMLGIADQYAGDEAHRLYYHLQLMWFLNFLYTEGLIRNIFKDTDLKKLDALLKSKSPRYYKETDELMAPNSQYYYVRHWRLGSVFYWKALKSSGIQGFRKAVLEASNWGKLRPLIVSKIINHLTNVVHSME